MNEFECFKQELKSSIKGGFNSLDEKNKEIHKTILRQLSLCSKSQLHTQSHKKNVKKINQLILNNLFKQIDVLPFLVKIKKLNIPLKVNHNLMRSLCLNFPPETQTVYKRIRQVDLFLQAFHSTKKEELFHMYLSNYKISLKNSYLLKEIISISLQELNEFQSYIEKRRLEFIIENQNASKVKLKL